MLVKIESLEKNIDYYLELAEKEPLYIIKDGKICIVFMPADYEKDYNKFLLEKRLIEIDLEQENSKYYTIEELDSALKKIINIS